MLKKAIDILKLYGIYALVGLAYTFIGLVITFTVCLVLSMTRLVPGLIVIWFLVTIVIINFDKLKKVKL